MCYPVPGPFQTPFPGTDATGEPDYDEGLFTPFEEGLRWGFGVFVWEARLDLGSGRLVVIFGKGNMGIEGFGEVSEVNEDL
ncbi:hypothetical protein CEXT_120161 [Caerostris extrusa]|uniref:Uncharacterized protein n=1 Tax=Caerostris extrusa TaxID=172846 RepID=A0AAV4YDA2_CAEEX|nr:hypothetical protein CEXT_120161 [Caerostris extrusa]